jgi:hypothetical protein
MYHFVIKQQRVVTRYVVIAIIGTKKGLFTCGTKKTRDDTY